MLASTIINHLLELRESSPVGTYGVAYFYCDYRETLKQQPLKALTTILSSLSSQNRTIFRAIQAFFQYQIKQNPAYVPEFDELLSNFGTFIGNQFERVLIVVDALDECADRECPRARVETNLADMPQRPCSCDISERNRYNSSF